MCTHLNVYLYMYIFLILFFVLLVVCVFFFLSSNFHEGRIRNAKRDPRMRFSKIWISSNNKMLSMPSSDKGVQYYNVQQSTLHTYERAIRNYCSLYTPSLIFVFYNVRIRRLVLRNELRDLLGSEYYSGFAALV